MSRSQIIDRGTLPDQMRTKPFFASFLFMDAWGVFPGKRNDAPAFALRMAMIMSGHPMFPCVAATIQTFGAPPPPTGCCGISAPTPVTTG